MDPERVIFLKATVRKTYRVPPRLPNAAGHAVNLPESRSLYKGADRILTAVDLNK
uniref:Uncharacterized protein n=1 Tax=uncultured prokaryote TaxID=198431 RepID=A0A0H5Q9B3_9ZZZZ|nr:hypothetical protein [uncultured prokaryote]